MPRPNQLAPEDQFPRQAIAESVQVQPDPIVGIPWQGGFWQAFTLGMATMADQIVTWGRNPKARDRQLREFWPTESFLAGAVANVSFRNAAFNWEIHSPSDAVEQSVTEMLRGALAGPSYGWVPFAEKISQDLYTQDNGTFIELIRDPTIDANSKFQGPMAPVIGIAQLDAGQCFRTGNAEYPVLYEDRETKLHKMAWYQVIPLADFPSSIERLNGIGYCAVTRALRLSQITRSMMIFKDEKISGRNPKEINIIGGVSQGDLDDATKRANERADNKGQVRYIDNIILASLDPEKPVSTATIQLASLPDGFDFAQEMQWYISGLALDFGVDYQEFAPLPGGAIGSSAQSMILHRKSSGKGPATFMRTLSEAFKNYGVLPRNAEMIFTDKNEQEELDKATLRKMFAEEMALQLRNGFIDADSARDLGVTRGFYARSELVKVPKGFGIDLAATTIREQAVPGAEGVPQESPKDLAMPQITNSVMPKKQPIGPTGGNTVAADAARTGSGAPAPAKSGRLQKAWKALRGK
jgi:hypothetical protein